MYISPKTPICLDSNSGLNVIYGSFQSPNTPSLLKPSDCFSTNPNAKSLHVFLNLFTPTLSLSKPKTSIAFLSVGSPCVSNPGT